MPAQVQSQSGMVGFSVDNLKRSVPLPITIFGITDTNLLSGIPKIPRQFSTLVPQGRR